MIRFTVPTAFWLDHFSRTPSDDGAAGICREVKRGKSRTVIEGDARQIEALRSDAAHYADADAIDAPAWLRRSAKATLAAIPQQAK